MGSLRILLAERIVGLARVHLLLLRHLRHERQVLHATVAGLGRLAKHFTIAIACTLLESLAGLAFALRILVCLIHSKILLQVICVAAVVSGARMRRVMRPSYCC